MAILSEFNDVTSQELSDIIRSNAVKTCRLEPLPSAVLKICSFFLLPVLTRIANLSINQGVMPSCRKEALLDPLLKQSSLDHELFCHYRPISNLMFTSKLCERVLAMQVNDHLNANGLVETFQSAYKVGHSTESTRLRSTDYGKGMLLLTLDLSAAFDTVDHYILLQRLQDRFGIQGSVYRWFESYLEERRQFVSIGKEQSTSRPLTCGSRRGPCSGPCCSHSTLHH